MSSSTSYLILFPFLPAESHEIVSGWLHNKSIHFKLTPGRKSKLGDYRPSHGLKPHRISLNRDMNPYLFLLTLVHELAHFQVISEKGWQKKPHGLHWKETYKDLLCTLFEGPVFPLHLRESLQVHVVRPPASCGLDLDLSKELSKYDVSGNSATYLEDVAEDAFFSVQGGRIFKKGPKLRKRYRCEEVSTKRLYLFQAGTLVELN